MSTDGQNVVLEQISQMRGAAGHRTEYENAIAAQVYDLNRPPKNAHAARLQLLDNLDDWAIGSREQIQRLLAMLGVLKTDLQQWSFPPLAFIACVDSWRLVANQWSQPQKHHQARRDELHKLLRNTPGRKVEAEELTGVDELFDEAARQASQHPTIPNPSTPPLFRYIEDSQDVNIRWELKYFNDKGGQNSGVALMCGVDQHGTIITRAVQKRIRPRRMDDPRDWVGDLVSGDTLPVLKEYATQVVASEANDARFILKTLAEPADSGNGEHRLYLEYAPHGDLDTVVDAHMGQGTKVPEAFAWLLFQALIESALILKKGVLHGAAPDDWRQIVHRDWKLGNVVLGLKADDHFPQYPRPRVSDFGFAIFTGEDDPLNPNFWVGDGTNGWYPPEGMKYIDSETGKVVDNWKMLSACNVWGIGIVMYGIMTQRWLNEWTQIKSAWETKMQGMTYPKMTTPRTTKTLATNSTHTSRETTV